MLCVIYARIISGYLSTVVIGESGSKAPKPLVCLSGLTSGLKTFTRLELSSHHKIKHSGWGEVPLSRCQSQETNSPPALDFAGEGVWGKPDVSSSFWVVRTPEEHYTPVVMEEIDLEAFTKTATLPHIIRSPSRIFGVSPQTQGAKRPSDTGQDPFSYLGPLGGAMPIPGLEDTQIHRGKTDSPLSRIASHLLASGTSEDIQEQNGAMGEELLLHSSNSTLWGTPSMDTVSGTHPGIARSFL